MRRDQSAPASAPDADPGYQLFRSSSYFPALDGLRALSILAVLWHHTQPPSIQGLLARGAQGVALFFAISGFLITTLLLREREKRGAIDLKGFYIRRTLRIMPLYFAVVALYTALVLALERSTPAGQEFLRNLPWFLTYTSNWFVDLTGPRVIFYFAWSLATEEQFYLVWPWVVRSGRTWRLPVAFMAVLLVVRLATYAGIAAGLLDEHTLAGRMLGSISLAIALGSLSAFAAHYHASHRVLASFAGRPWSAPLAFGLMAAALTFAQTPKPVLYVAMTYLVVACCLHPGRFTEVVLANRPLRWIGTVSYGIYLLHLLVINVARRVLGEPYGPAVFALALPLSVAVASASYLLFERPLARLGKR